MRFAVYLDGFLDAIYDDEATARQFGKQMWYVGYEVTYVRVPEGEHPKNRLD